MSYRIAQDFEYAGNNYWRWWAWIDGNDDELDRVQEVVWILHPTFRQTRVRVTDRASKFRLETAGWGTFLLRAEVALTDGDTQMLKHNLQLEYRERAGTPPTGSLGATPAARPLTVYLSYSAQDSRTASKLREGLKKAGLEVTDQTRLGAGNMWTEALKRMNTQADGVIGLVDEDEMSPWVAAELEAAVAADKPAFLLLPPQASSTGIPNEVRTLRVDASGPDPSKLAELVRSRADHQG